MQATDTLNAAINELFANSESAIARDLKLNFNKHLTSEALDQEEVLYTLLASATSVGHETLMKAAKESLQEVGKSPEEIQEAAELAGFMAMNNIYYRFRHIIKDGQGANIEKLYAQAGLRMNAMRSPLLGKTVFEMLSLAVSVINGCAMCINAHESSLRKLDVSSEKIHDLVKIAALTKALKDFSHSQN